MTGSHPLVPLPKESKVSPRQTAVPFKLFSFKSSLNSRLLLGLLIMLTLFSACELPGLKSAPLREPPLIPSPPDAPSPAAAKEELHVANYADTEAIQNFSPELPQAVARALRLSVLKPATPQSQFEPERAITYGEFRQWANDYQNALIDAKTEENATAPKDSPPPAAGPLAPPATIAAHMGNATFLPAEMLWGSHGVRELNTLNRESLCALGVFLNGQDGVARKMTPAQIAATQPGQDADPSMTAPSDSNEGDFSQLSDFSRISPWAQRYVALAYKNDWFQPVFNLSMAQVTTDEGIHPTQAVTRGEAMLLLHLLYGQREPGNNATSGSPSSAMMPGSQGAMSGTSATRGMQSTNALPMLQPSGQNAMLPSKSSAQRMTAQPMPIGHMQSMQEKGPQGSRSAIRISGPE